jgi:hypothetical protein
LTPVGGSLNLRTLCRVVGSLKGDSQNPVREESGYTLLPLGCKGGRVTERGCSEYRPVVEGVSRCSTIGILPTASSDLSVHRGNGCRAYPQETLGSLVRKYRIELDCWRQKPLWSSEQSDDRPERGRRRSSQEVECCRVDDSSLINCGLKHRMSQQYVVLFRGETQEQGGSL